MFSLKELRVVRVPAAQVRNVMSEIHAAETSADNCNCVCWQRWFGTDPTTAFESPHRVTLLDADINDDGFLLAGFQDGCVKLLDASDQVRLIVSCI